MVVRYLRSVLPLPLPRLPADLAASVAVVLLADLVALYPAAGDAPLRIVLGLPLLLFVPGYVLVAALFPGAGGTAPGSADADAGQPDENRGIDGTERVTLAFGTSIAITSLIALALHLTPWGIRTVPVLSSLSVFTVLAVLVAVVRRRDLPDEERFSVDYRSWLAAGRSALFEPETRTDAVVNVLVVAGLLVAVASVGYAVSTPKESEPSTEFSLLTRGTDGELAAGDYPTELVVGQPEPLVVGIANHEHETVTYTVVVELQRVALVGDDSTRVTESRELDRFDVTVAGDETWRGEYRATPTMAGDSQRLVFLLYREQAPSEPTIENAYRETHLWVNVSAGGG